MGLHQHLHSKVYHYYQYYFADVSASSCCRKETYHCENAQVLPEHQIILSALPCHIWLPKVSKQSHETLEKPITTRIYSAQSSKSWLLINLNTWTLHNLFLSSFNRFLCLFEDIDVAEWISRKLQILLHWQVPHSISIIHIFNSSIFIYWQMKLSSSSDGNNFSFSSCRYSIFQNQLVFPIAL